MGDPDETVIKGGAWRFISVGMWAFVALLCFLFTIAPSGGVDGQTTTGRVVCGTATVGSLVIAVRVLRARVVLRADSLLWIQGWTPARTILRSDIDTITLEVIDSKVTGDVTAPVITLSSGKFLALRQLARYSTRSAQEKGAREVDLLNAWLSRTG